MSDDSGASLHQRLTRYVMKPPASASAAEEAVRCCTRIMSSYAHRYRSRWDPLKILVAVAQASITAGHPSSALVVADAVTRLSCPHLLTVGARKALDAEGQNPSHGSTASATDNFKLMMEGASKESAAYEILCTSLLIYLEAQCSTMMECTCRDKRNLLLGISDRTLRFVMDAHESTEGQNRSCSDGTRKTMAERWFRCAFRPFKKGCCGDSDGPELGWRFLSIARDGDPWDSARNVEHRSLVARALRTCENSETLRKWWCYGRDVVLQRGVAAVRDAQRSAAELGQQQHVVDVAKSFVENEVGGVERFFRKSLGFSTQSALERLVNATDSAELSVDDIVFQSLRDVVPWMTRVEADVYGCAGRRRDNSSSSDRALSEGQRHAMMSAASIAIRHGWSVTALAMLRCALSDAEQDLLSSSSTRTEGCDSDACGSATHDTAEAVACAWMLSRRGGGDGNGAASTVDGDSMGCEMNSLVCAALGGTGCPECVVTHLVNDDAVLTPTPSPSFFDQVAWDRDSTRERSRSSEQRQPTHTECLLAWWIALRSVQSDCTPIRDDCCLAKGTNTNARQISTCIQPPPPPALAEVGAQVFSLPPTFISAALLKQTDMWGWLLLLQQRFFSKAQCSLSVGASEQPPFSSSNSSTAADPREFVSITPQVQSVCLPASSLSLLLVRELLQALFVTSLWIGDLATCRALLPSIVATSVSFCSAEQVRSSLSCVAAFVWSCSTAEPERDALPLDSSRLSLEDARAVLLGGVPTSTTLGTDPIRHCNRSLFGSKPLVELPGDAAGAHAEAVKHSLRIRQRAVRCTAGQLAGKVRVAGCNGSSCACVPAASEQLNEEQRGTVVQVDLTSGADRAVKILRTDVMDGVVWERQLKIACHLRELVGDMQRLSSKNRQQLAESHAMPNEISSSADALPPRKWTGSSCEMMMESTGYAARPSDETTQRPTERADDDHIHNTDESTPAIDAVPSGAEREQREQEKRAWWTKRKALDREVQGVVASMEGDHGFGVWRLAFAGNIILSHDASTNEKHSLRDIAQELSHQLRHRDGVKWLDETECFILLNGLPYLHPRAVEQNRVPLHVIVQRDDASPHSLQRKRSRAERDGSSASESFSNGSKESIGSVQRDTLHYAPCDCVSCRRTRRSLCEMLQRVFEESPPEEGDGQDGDCGDRCGISQNAPLATLEEVVESAVRKALCVFVDALLSTRVKGIRNATHPAISNDMEQSSQSSDPCAGENDRASRCLSPRMRSKGTSSRTTVDLLSIPRQHVYLVLDRRIQGLPFEGMSALYYSQSSSRLPCGWYTGPSDPFHGVANACSHDRVARGAMLHRARPSADGCKPFLYLVNPSGDATASEKRWKDFIHLSPWMWSDRSVCGREGAEAIANGELLRMFYEEGTRMYAYVGHGCGEAWLSRSQLAMRVPDERWRHGRFPSTLLMGCSSASLDGGDSYDCVGMPYSYLYAGCRALVGCLWHVTDGEIDKVTLSLLRSIIPDEEGSHYPEGSPATTGTLASPDAMTTDDALPSPLSCDVSRWSSMKDDSSPSASTGTWSSRGSSDMHSSTLTLGQALCSARKACRLRYLTGSAVVLYGANVRVDEALR